MPRTKQPKPKRKKPRAKWYKAEVIQNGEVVATVQSRSKLKVGREAAYYAIIYAQDGPVTVRQVLPKSPSPRKGAVDPYEQDRIDDARAGIGPCG